MIHDEVWSTDILAELRQTAPSQTKTIWQANSIETDFFIENLLGVFNDCCMFLRGIWGVSQVY